ncbi:MAG TPA: hypothetical protein VGB82_06985 [Alphaproteobacteria bacterium]
MSERTAGDRAAAAQQIIAAMVRPSIRVSVHIDHTLTDDHRSVTVSRTVRPAAALVSVEMVGPDGAFHKTQKKVVAKGEAHAWCNDEILSAARRAAEGIIRQHPAWRRDRANSRPAGAA